MLSNLYQTLEYRNNNDYIEKDGPFPCTHSNAWLGDGYYFWDTFINHAHLWGMNSYKQNGYVICKSIIDLQNLNIFDLDSPQHLLVIKEVRDILKSKYPNETITVPYIINYLKDNVAEFNYNAVRARGITENNFNNSKRFIKYNPQKRSFLDLTPQIQICILDKKVIGENNFKIIHEKPSISPINI